MSKMICPKERECKSETCPHKGKHDKWITCDDSYTGNCGKCIPVEEEKKMKCPTCKKELERCPNADRAGYEAYYCLEHLFYTHVPVPKPNPSPRDIFQHIKTEYERKAFDELLTGNDVYWYVSLPETVMTDIGTYHPDWWQWLIQKGLVEKKKVKKQAWTYVYWSQSMNRPFASNTLFDSEDDAKFAGKENGGFIKTILLHEEEE